ncbi:MAG: CsbD family protein [Actinotalea sp.]|nr:CsbD family protein [Actinotalea sp.]
MGNDDKLRNTGEEWGGKAKEGAGRVIGDRDLEAEGRTDQSKASIKQAGEKVKDAFRD